MKKVKGKNTLKIIDKNSGFQFETNHIEKDVFVEPNSDYFYYI